jgi:hypothetical protein
MKFTKTIYIFLIIIIAAFQTSALHRFHTTLTRIDYNAEKKLYEISIQLFTHDLVPLLERRSGKPIDLEKNSDADRLIFEYLKENFVLTNKKEQIKTLKWVGKEFDTSLIRIYVETSSEETPEGYQLKNTLFFESHPKQINLVVWRYDGKKADLRFKVGDKAKEISENKIEEQ